jgi:hypothetical protein
VRRLVLSGHTGYLTLEAVRWMTDVGIGFCQIDTDGPLTTTSSIIGNDDPRLRRAQALAVTNGTDITLARDLTMEAEGKATERWFTSGVRGIGLASLRLMLVTRYRRQTSPHTHVTTYPTR